MKGFLERLNQPLKLQSLKEPLKLPKLFFGRSGGAGLERRARVNRKRRRLGRSFWCPG